MRTHGSITQIAAELDFPVGRLRKLIQRGEIPAAKVGPKFIVRTQAVNEWLEGKVQNESAEQGEVRRVDW